uniref:CD276 molecule n=2 Tax=Homininae TaxID=207598 RepID=H0YLT3_HUMAN
MLRRRGSPGMGVHVGAALGALWFCLTADRYQTAGAQLC